MNLIHVTVAYNSPGELENLFGKIDEQEESNHYILCIDNSDLEYKEKNEDLCKEFSLKNSCKIDYYRTKINLGSANGFALGMQLAIEKGADWIWLHDQDGYPLPGCYRKLEEHLSDEAEIYSPQVVDEYDNCVPNFHGKYDKFWNFHPVLPENERTIIQVAGTAGLIINRRVIERIGVYDYLHYSTGFEDYDFCLRAGGMGFSIVMINDAHYYHPNKWEHLTFHTKKKIYSFFGEIASYGSMKKTQSSINYNIRHSKNIFLLSFLYSFFKVFARKLMGRRVALFKTYKCYFSATRHKYFENSVQIRIDPHNYLTQK